MSDNPTNVDLGLEVRDNLEEVRQRAQAVNQELEKQNALLAINKQRYLEAANAATKPAGFTSYEQARGALGALPGETVGARVMSAAQRVDETQQRIVRLQAQAADDTQRDTRRKKQLSDEDYLEQRRQLQRRQQLWQEENTQAQTLRQSLMSLASPSNMGGVLGALAMGGSGGGIGAAGFVSRMVFGRAAIGLGSAIGRTVSGAIGGSAAAGGADAAGAAGGLAGGLAGIAGAGAGVLAALAPAALLFGNQQAAQAATAGAGFRANVGGAGNASDMAINRFTETISGTARQYQYDRQTGFNVATTLGLMGVPMQGTNGITNRQGGTLSAVLAASRQSQQDPTQIAQFFGSMMVVGGQTLAQTTRAFRELGVQADKTGIPLNRMIQSVVSLQAATGGAAINAAGLSAIQGMVGPGVNAGTLISPLVGATGAQALAFGGILGLSPGQFQSAQFGANRGQGNPLGLMQAVGAFLRRSVGSSATPQNIALGETLLQGTGLLNLQGVAPVQQQEIVRALLTGQTAQAQKIQQGIAGANLPSTADWQNSMIQNAMNQTDILTQIEIASKDEALKLGIIAAALGPKPSPPGAPPGQTNILGPHGTVQGHVPTSSLLVPTPGTGVGTPHNAGTPTPTPGPYGSAPLPDVSAMGKGDRSYKPVVYNQLPPVPPGSSVHPPPPYPQSLTLHLTGTFTGPAGTMIMDPQSINFPVNLGRTPIGYSNETPRPMPPRPKFGRGP